MIAVSRLGVPIGEDSPHAKYTDREVDLVLQLRGEAFSYRQIARMMEMPRSTVFAICTGLIRGKIPHAYRRQK
jgi:hypothetical protein|uniref:Uncharacterized protein n=1 Tax=Siphoviridae sp. ctRg81 TaxID=2826336 RepID=A0A8S5NI13_9CAUD|nr:MAG TPA: Protein of unknown function (DUF2481) [Siphoviridae sp. ctRg81]DAI29915.1 MAG TPA: Protein of unknown function (DUF2481) [Caudoviricetes sp.]DAI95942.1 MAG TPA: Protein of unknown function (DUF2481) [Caudoviricetes sp.]DAM98921.1 MAG TPA: Protein of unknown function (DUF2481) [Caudoviricetes sp.]DAP63996.1 MAG TPA: Protein of unknown function (DUF2481) [Caudoviricetes sp.]